MREREESSRDDSRGNGGRAEQEAHSRREEAAVVARYTDSLIFDNKLPADVRSRAEKESQRLEGIVGRNEDKVCEAWHLWRCVEQNPDAEPMLERNLAFAALLIRASLEAKRSESAEYTASSREHSDWGDGGRRMSVPSFADRSSWDDDKFDDDDRQFIDRENDKRRLVGMDIEKVPESTFEKARRASFDDDMNTMAAAGQEMRAHDPQLCRRVAEYMLIPYVIDRLACTDAGNHEVWVHRTRLVEKDSTNISFWSAQIVDDAIHGSEARETVPDSLLQMKEGYRTAVGLAAATLAIDSWENHERSCTGGYSRQFSSTFQICRLVCADLIDEARADGSLTHASVFERLRYGGAERALYTKAVALMEKVHARLVLFAENPNHYVSQLPDIE